MPSDFSLSRGGVHLLVFGGFQAVPSLSERGSGTRDAVADGESTDGGLCSSVHSLTRGPHPEPSRSGGTGSSSGVGQVRGCAPFS